MIRLGNIPDYPKGEVTEDTQLGYMPTLLTKARQGWKCLPKSTAIAYSIKA